MTTAPRLVRVTSYLNAAQADLARMQLAVEGIPAYLENAAFLSWLWHYSNATGGVKLYVLDADAERAHAVLWSWRQAVVVALPPWTCPNCAADVDAAWMTCWHCGASTDGEEDPNFWEQPTVEMFPLKCSESTLAPMIGISGPLLLLLSPGSFLLFTLWVVVVVALLCMWQTMRPADEDRSTPEYDAIRCAVVESVAQPAEQSTADGYAMIEETILRAWQAAVLSLWFPPLAFYALWLLRRLALPEEPLKPREQRRYLGAWTFSLIVIATCLCWVAMV